MAQEIEKVATGIFEKIRTRFDKVNLGDENAQSTADAEKARFFNFDYVSQDGQNFGNITISIVEENALKVYFSKNISDKLDAMQKKEWFNFLYDLRKFSRRHMMTFDTRDVSRSSLNIKDLKNVSKNDGNTDVRDISVNESRLYGTPKTSFENVGSARIRIVHTESVNPEVRGSRARHINAIYVENAIGERFRLVHNSLSGARAMARHIAEGGAPYDDIGNHITEMISEMKELGVFVRGMRRRTFEDAVASDMLNASIQYYNGMNRQLNHLKGIKAYRTFVENFEPQAQQLDEVDLNDIKERFVKKIFDDRMTAALPHVYKAYQLQEQSKTAQAQAVKNIVNGKATLQLATNEGMDEYMKMLSFADADSMVVSVLEDIAVRAVSMPEVAEFASRWASAWNTISESDDIQVREHKTLAVQLATQYIKDLSRLKENAELRTAVESDLVDFDRGFNQLDEGTWALPKTDQQMQELSDLLKKPLPFGVDATTATSALYHLIGDDILFDALGSAAETQGPEADARQTISEFLKRHMPGIYASLGLGETGELDRAPAQPTQAVTPEKQTQQSFGQAPSPQVGTHESLDRIMHLAGVKSILVK
jgi:hypothetical protein